MAKLFNPKADPVIQLNQINHSAGYVAAIEQLVSVAINLSRARELESITEIVREAARDLTGADGATFILRDGDQCYYLEENTIAPLWKGQRLHISSCISGWVMTHSRPAIIEDIYKDPRVPLDSYRSTFVKSLVMVPICQDAPIGAIGNYWAEKKSPTEDEVKILQALADITATALENAQLYSELQQKIRIMQKQQARIHEQRDSLEIFTRSLAHDLREPVHTMKSFVDLIMRQPESADKTHDYFRHIKSASERMEMLIETVFLYTQLDDPAKITKEQCPMQDVLESVKLNLGRLIHEHGTIITSGALPVMYANTSQMVQVIQNLVSNAIRHNEGNISINISAEERHGDWIFCVRDNGCGVASEYLDKIFIPFKRLANNKDCAGLGLATCKKIIELHGGRIWCDSSQDSGASFFFTLKKNILIAEPGVAQAAGAVVVDGEAKLANVLLVDDRESDIELTRILLDEAGLHCNLMVANNSSEALGIIREHSSQGNPVDLMLLDINIPGMDGFELLEYMRKDEKFSNIAVVMCTVSIYDKDEKRAKSLGAIGYVLKPPSMQKLKPIFENMTTLKLLRQGEHNYILARAAA